MPGDGGTEGEGVSQGSTEDVYGSETTLYDTMCKGGYMSLHICPDSQNGHQE